MNEREIIRFRKKIFNIGGYMTFGLCLLLSLSLMFGCSSDAMSGEEQRNLTPYSLTGSKGDWEISCVVRELTPDEKKEQLNELEKNWKAEEELLLSQEGGQQIYEQTKEQYELIRQELKEKKAYVSIIYGICRDEELKGMTFDYRLTDKNNKKIVSGTQTVSPESGQWYRSWQTETNTRYGLFIPPIQKAKMIINIGDEKITVPLELSTNQEKSL